MTPKYVTGLDLSLTGTGIVTINLETQQTHRALVKTAGTARPTLTETLDRLQSALTGIVRHIPAERALIIVEAPSFGSSNGKAHERAGLWWRTAAYLHSRGHVVTQAYPRTRAKYAAGHLPVKSTRKGPDKKEVVAALTAEHPHLDLTDNNIADAFALAALGARHLGAPIDSPTKQRGEAVTAVRWPRSTTNQKGQ